jgi:uncharacterized protein YbbC (DUF1343 family)
MTLLKNQAPGGEAGSFKVLPGLDQLQGIGNGTAAATPAAQSIADFLRGRKVGLLTNHTGRTSTGTTALQVLQQLDVQLAALFSPEHGVTGTREGHIESEVTREGLPLYSLYGTSRRPTCKMLANIDALVCDLQDVGARFYTYATTFAYTMEECAARGIAVVVLDRPNPLGGAVIEGPQLEDECRSFVGYLRVPARHGLTLGELALFHRHDHALDLELKVLPIANWRRSMLWPATALPWPVPSPNLPDFTATAWYPATCLLEFSNVSVGRGTAAPFQTIGAPWMEPQRVLDAMQSWPDALRTTLIAEPVEFVPTRATFSGETCQGLTFHSSTSDELPTRPLALGMALLSTLHRVHPDEFNDESLQASLPLLGSTRILGLLRAGEIEAAIAAAAADATAFRTRRSPYLLYPDASAADLEKDDIHSCT